MPSLLCLDLGTSAAKAALLALDGTTRAQVVRGYPTRTTADGGAEQDPADWVRAAREAITQLLGGADAELLALSITGQMQDLVLLTEGDPAPAILYSDTRAVAEVEEIRESLGREGVDWDRITGNELDATSCAAMFRRLSRTLPDAVGRARGVVFGPAGYLVHALGLGAWCDMTTASATGLLDARTRRWSEPVARAAGLDRAMLPELTGATGQILGRTDEAAAELLGLPAGLPVVLAPGDAGATTLGIVGLEEGDEYAYLGTSGWLAAVVSGTRRGEEGTSHHLALGGRDDSSSARTLRISALLAAGAAAGWARGALLAGISPEEADDLLEQREAERGRGPTGLLALPSIHGERYPVRAPDLRAAIIGMGPDTGAIDMYAAVLEGVAHALAHALAESAADADADTDAEDPAVGDAPARPAPPEPPARPEEPGSSSRPLAVAGGGAASEPWMRILADVTGRPVRIIEHSDAALLGCAFAAADALDLEHTIRPLAEQGGGRRVEPEASAVRQHARLRRSHRALYQAVAEVGALR